MQIDSQLDLGLNICILLAQLLDHILTSVIFRAKQPTASVSGLAPASIIPTHTDRACLSRPTVSEDHVTLSYLCSRVERGHTELHVSSNPMIWTHHRSFPVRSAVGSRLRMAWRDVSMGGELDVHVNIGKACMKCSREPSRDLAIASKHPTDSG
jgi:hypothetical protein